MATIDDELYEDIQILLGTHKRNHSIGFSQNSWKINNGYTLTHALIWKAEHVISFKGAQDLPAWDELVSTAKSIIDIVQTMNSCLDLMGTACRKLNNSLRKAKQSPEFNSIPDDQRYTFDGIRNHDYLLRSLEDEDHAKNKFRVVEGLSAMFASFAEKMQSNGKDPGEIKPFEDLAIGLTSLIDPMHELARLREAARDAQKAGIQHFESYMADTMFL